MKNSLRASLRSNKRKLDDAQARFCLKKLGNSLGLKTNLFYWVQHILSRLQSRKISCSREGKKDAIELRALGFTKVGGLDLDELSGRVFTYFSAHPPKNGVGYMDRSATPALAPLVFRALEKVTPVLNHYFGSHFQAYWSSVMRYDTSGAQTSDSSFGYHFDDNPSQLLKVFLYLNDTYESNGAFRCFNYARTRDLLRKGFVSFSPETRMASQKLISPDIERNELYVLEGKKGTALIFDNNLVHKGTIPREGYRDVVVIEVFPGPRPIDVESLQRSLSVGMVRDYPKNPFIYDLPLVSPK